MNLQSYGFMAVIFLALLPPPAIALTLQDIINDNIKSDISNYLNKELPQKLFNKSGIKVNNNTNLQLGVYRNGTITPNVYKDGIGFTMPIRFIARGDWKTERRIRFGIGSKGVTIRHHENTKGSLVVKARMQLISIGCAGVVSKTTATFQWVEKPEIKVGPATIRISGIAGRAVQNQLNTYSARVNDLINSRTAQHIRNYLQCN